MFYVSKDFSFAAAHFLTKYHGKCERLHGHNYKLRVTVKGERAENGMVVDFVLLKKLVKKLIIEPYDHQCLNDFIENPTAENLAKHFWDLLNPLPEKLQALISDPNFPPEIKRLLKEAKDAKLDPLNNQLALHEVTVWETDTSFVTYRE